MITRRWMDGPLENVKRLAGRYPIHPVVGTEKLWPNTSLAPDYSPLKKKFLTTICLMKAFTELVLDVFMPN